MLHFLNLVSLFIYLFIFHIYINIHKYKLSVLINFLFTELVLKVKKQGDELYRQIFLTKLTFGELREKISTKFQLKIEEISTIVLLPDIAILDDDDVGTLTTGDVLEIRINCGMYFWFLFLYYIYFSGFQNVYPLEPKQLSSYSRSLVSMQNRPNSNCKCDYS